MRGNTPAGNVRHLSITGLSECTRSVISPPLMGRWSIRTKLHGCCAIGDEQYNEPHVSCAQSDIESITITTPLEGGAQGSLHTQLSTQLRKQTCISLSTRVQSLLRARCCESLSFKSPTLTIPSTSKESLHCLFVRLIHLTLIQLIQN